MPALRGDAGQAGTALTARGDGPDDDPIAPLIPDHAGAELFDDPDRLVTDDEPVTDGVLALEDVHVGPADRRQRHLEQRLSDARHGSRNLAQSDLPFALKHRCLHRRAHSRILSF